jgi:hypothetical protein
MAIGLLSILLKSVAVVSKSRQTCSDSRGSERVSQSVRHLSPHKEINDSMMESEEDQFVNAIRQFLDAMGPERVIQSGRGGLNR